MALWPAIRGLLVSGLSLSLFRLRQGEGCRRPISRLRLLGEIWAISGGTRKGQGCPTEGLIQLPHLNGDWVLCGHKRVRVQPGMILAEREANLAKEKELRT